MLNYNKQDKNVKINNTEKTMNKILSLALFIIIPFFIKPMEGQGEPCPGYEASVLEKGTKKRKTAEVNQQINHESRKQQKNYHEEQYMHMLFNTIFRLIEESDIRAIEELLAQFNHLVNAKNKNGETPFMFAVMLGHLNIATKLLKYGSNINAQDNIGNTALIHAAQLGNRRSVDFLVFYQPNINIQNILGRTALMEAAAIHDLAIIEILHNNNARTELIDNHGQAACDIYQNRAILKGAQTTETKLKNLFNINNEPIYKAFFNPEDDIRSILINLIQCEKRNIKIAAHLMMDIHIAQALIEAKNNGVEVEVIIDRECLNHYTVSELYQNKVGVWVYKPQNNIILMHNKFCIFTDNVEHKSLLFSGSYSFTYNASSFHQENIIILDNISIIKQFLDRFVLLKNKSIKI